MIRTSTTIFITVFITSEKCYKAKKLSEDILIPKFVTDMIGNSNWTEWSTIQGVIVKLQARLLPELYDTRSNY